MQPKSYDVKALCLWAPKIAYGMVAGVPRVPVVVDMFAATWPEGWLLYKQSNVKVAAILLQTPVSVPFNVTITFLGWQFLAKEIDDLSDADCRDRLRLLGFEVPDLNKVLLK